MHKELDSAAQRPSSGYSHEACRVQKASSCSLKEAPSYPQDFAFFTSSHLSPIDIPDTLKMRSASPSIEGVTMSRSITSTLPKSPYPLPPLPSRYLYSDENAKAQALADVDVSTVTPAELKHVLRKIDYFLMPLMCIAVLLQFLDKTSLNYASLLGLKKDTHLKGQEYSWLAPSSTLATSSPLPSMVLFAESQLSRYVAMCIVFWSISLGAHAACTNYGQLVGVRFLLGWWEAALTPAFILLTGRFYTKQEQVTRTSIWFANNGWAQILGGGISYALQVQKPSKLKVWRQMYLILGGIALLFGIIVLLFMPDSPATVRYLNERERQVAVHRIKKNKSGIHDTK